MARNKEILFKLSMNLTEGIPALIEALLVQRESILINETFFLEGTKYYFCKEYAH